jgi:hypothetical protein
VFPLFLLRACFKNDRRISVAFAQGLKPPVLQALVGTTEQLAEKVLNLNEEPEKHTSGAEASADSEAFIPGLKSRPTAG